MVPTNHGNLRPAEPERDFVQLAALFTSLEDEPATEAGLREFYEKAHERVLQAVAEDEAGDLPGFYWAERDRSVPEHVYFYLYVKPERRGLGIGRRLYADMLRALEAGGVKRLRVSIRDDCPEGLAFAGRRGFVERGHSIGMALDLGSFDDRPYDEILARLEGEGFRLTSMEELGDTEEAQRKLYALNDATDRDTPGTDGEPSWESFEDFQASVCRSEWYKPGGQMVAIDTAAGTWAAMSAITVLPGCGYAYNLHTGVDRLYRGRRLGQAVKVRALRYARDVLQARHVRTHHMVQNVPMIAIDRKLGYVQVPGLFSMQKNLE